jgi:hypothetical protein
MRRWIGLVIGVVTLAAGSWLLAGLAVRMPSRMVGNTQVVAGSLDDLMMDLQLVPLDGQAPKPFSLASLEGRHVALADLAGRPALLYFWATW